MLNQCLESLVQKIQSGVVINFEKTGPDPPPLEGKRHICFIPPSAALHTFDLWTLPFAPRCFLMLSEQFHCHLPETAAGFFYPSKCHLWNLTARAALMFTQSHAVPRKRFFFFKCAAANVVLPLEPLASFRPDAAPETLKSGVQPWHCCHKLIYVRPNPKTGVPIGHWPIPEAFWPDQNSPTLVRKHSGKKKKNLISDFTRRWNSSHSFIILPDLRVWLIYLADNRQKRLIYEFECHLWVKSIFDWGLTVALKSPLLDCQANASVWS